MWDTLDLDKYDRAFTSIEPRAKSLASLNGWEPHNTDTVNAIRDTALEIRDTSTAAARKIYALWRSGNLNDTADQLYFWPSSDAELTAPTSAVMTGYINQLVLIYDLAGSDNRNSNGVNWFTRCAEVGKTIVMEQHAVNYAEIMPVSAANTIDPKLVASDGTIGGGGIYADVVFNLDVDEIYSGLVDGTPYNFWGYVEGDLQDNQTVHEKINWLWRQATDINFSSVNNGTGTADGPTKRGDKQFPLTTFSGDVFTLLTYLESFNAAERNNLRVVDNIPVERSWPSILTLSVQAASLAIGGTFTVYHSSSFGTDSATIFEDEGDVQQQDITIAANVDIVMAYSTYVVGGHTANTPLDITVAFNRPGFIEPDTLEATLSGTNLAVTISPTADPSYIA